MCKQEVFRDIIKGNVVTCSELLNVAWEGGREHHRHPLPLLRHVATAKESKLLSRATSITCVMTKKK